MKTTLIVESAHETTVDEPQFSLKVQNDVGGATVFLNRLAVELLLDACSKWLSANPQPLATQVGHSQ